MKDRHGPDGAASRFFAKNNPPRRAAHRYRRLLLEPLEPRRLLTPLAELWYEFDPLSGPKTTPPAQTAGPLLAGQKYMLNAYIQDARGAAATGLETAYINLSYDATLISLVGSVVPDDFPNDQDVSLSSGLISQVGGFTNNTNPTDPSAAVPFFSVEIQVAAGLTGTQQLSLGTSLAPSNLPIAFLPPGAVTVGAISQLGVNDLNSTLNGSTWTSTIAVTANTAPAITSANNTTFKAGTAGTFTVTTTGFPNSTLSESGTLPGGVSFTNNGDGTATLAGTPATGSAGTYPIAITADNGISPNATQSFTLTVGQAPTITSANNTTFKTGTAGTFTVITTGFPNSTLNESGTLPGGVTFTDNGNGTATLAGTPVAGSGGTYPIAITADNGVSPNATQTFALTVYQAPAISSANSTTFKTGTAGTFAVITTGFPDSILSESGTLPGGVSFTNNGNDTATLAGTPVAGSGGTYPIAITADNGVPPNATQSFTLTVYQAPAITSANSTTFKTGTAGTFTVTTTGFPNSTLSESGTLPSGVSFTNNGNGTAALAGMPAAGSGGTYPIVITADNGVSPNATQTFTLTVFQAPAISSANTTTFTVGTAGTFSVTTTGFPNSILNESGTLPGGVTFTDNGNGTATLAGMPAAGSGGTYPIAITADNGVSPNATQTFTLTVFQAPAISSANSTTFKTGTAGSFSVTTTGFPNSILTESGTLPGGVTFTDNGNGTATLAGTAATGSGGTYPIVITADNGVSPNATQTFALTVYQAPAITSANNTTFKTGTAGTFAVITTGFPDSILSESGTLPGGVSFTDNGNDTATLTGTPAAGSGGTYPIAITADNGVPPIATQSFTLTVDQTPAITSANSTTFTVGTAGSFTVTTSGFPTSALTKSGTLPGGVTFTDNGNGTATLAGTPAAGTGGTYTLTLTANNGVSPNATQSFTLAVNQAPAITSANNTTFTVGTAGTFTVTTTGLPNSTLTESGTLPGGVTFTNNGNGTATLAGTPAAGSGGAYSVTITANNGISPNATQSFTLAVDQAPAITSANSTTFTVGTPGSFTVTTSGFPTSALTKSGTLPNGLTFTNNGNGTATLAGTPAASSGGTYTLTISASNGTSPNATQSFTLTVDQAPAITSANNTTFTVGTAGTFTVTTSGFPNSTLTESGTLPGGVTFTNNGNGTATLAGTPAAGSGGAYSVTITANNGISPNATQIFTLTVDQAPAITSANSTTFPVGTADSFTVSTSAFPKPALSETGTLPAGVTFTDNGNGTATLAGTPTAGAGTSYVLTITASNGILPNATQSFTLTVGESPTITSAASVTFPVSVAGSFTLTAKSDPIASLSFSGALPSGVTFTDNGNGTATLAGTPAAGTVGSYPLTITATNGILPNGTQAFTLTVGQAPSITSTNSTKFTVGTAGSFIVTTSGLPKAALSESGTLPGGVTFTDNGNGTATFAGTPAAGSGGTYTLDITAGNGILPNATQAFTLTVDQAPAITSASGTTFTVGNAGTFTVTTSGFPTPALSTSGTLPSGVTFTDNGNGTATLAGTPAAGTLGIYPLTIAASNGIAPNGTQAFTLTVGQAPAITSTNSTTFTVGTAGSFIVTTSGLPKAALSESGTLPGGVTFTDNGNGMATLAGTPAAGRGGTYTLNITADNGILPNATQSFTLTVDQAPAITSANGTTFTVGKAGTFTVTTSGFPTPALSTSGTLPSGVTFTDNGDGTATLAGTPAAGTVGTYPLTITASNGTSPNGTQSFTLTVDQAPAITSTNSATFTVGTAGSFTVTTSGLPKSALSENGTLPGGVTFTDNGNGTATLAGTPAAGRGGTYTLNITADNGILPNATQAFTLTVDQAPAITSTNGTTFTVGKAGTFTVTTSGFPTPALSTSGTLPSGVTFTDNGNGTATLAGTPAAGTVGTYPFTIAASNGISPNGTQSFTLTVDQAPAITSANSATFTVGTAGSFTVTTSGLPKSALSESGMLPGGVTFTDNGNGTATLAGTPAAGSGGTFALNITAGNGILPNATQAFTLTLDQAPAITSASDTTFTVGRAGTFTVNTSGFPKSVSTESGTLPSGVTFTDNGDGTATLAGTPAAGSGGTYALDITASNGISPNATQSFTLTVDQAPAISSANSATFTVGTAGSFTVTTSGLPKSALSESGTLPGGVTFTDNGNGTATLAGTPAAGSGGTYAFTLTANNGVSPNATQAFTLTVDQAPAITSANGTTFTIGRAGTFTVSTSGFPTSALSTSGTLPSGVTFTDNGNGTATLAGTPAAGTVGTYPFTIAASNGISPNAAQVFTLTVGQAPTITSANSTTFTVGTAGSFTVTTSGLPKSALSETGTLPGGVTFTDNGNGTATLAGTPAADSGGTYTLNITADNGILPNATQRFTLTVDQAPAITSANSTTFKTGTAATFTVITTGFPDSILSESGTLPSGVTFLDNGNGTATLAGTAAAGSGGTYALTFAANNGVSPNATQAFTLTVDQAPAITSANSATFTVDTAGSFTVTSNGLPKSALSESGSLPGGVTFTDNGNGTATLAGIPAAGSGGTYTFTLTANNGVSPNATQSFTLTVDQAPAITSTNGTTFTVGKAGTFTVTTSGFPTPALSTSGTLPSGVTFTDNGNGTATLAGTPAAGTVGTYPLTITATNGILPNGTQAFALTVGEAPTITSASSTTLTVGTAGSFTVTTSGLPKSALSETGTLPGGVTFTDNGNGTATLAGTPAADSGGTYSFTLTAGNGILPNATQSFTLTVDQAPAITSTNGTTFTVGKAGTFTVTTSGFPNSTLNETGTLPSGLTFADNGNGTATLAGIAAAGTEGTYSITMMASNGISPNATQSFTLTVDQAPAITSANSATFTVGTVGSFTVTTSGLPKSALSETGTLPGGVTFTDNGNGTATLAGTPAAGSGDTYAFTLTANNGVSPNATQAFTLTVDQAPEITSTTGTTFTVGKAGTFTVTTSGFPTSVLSTSGALPGGVTFTGNGNGTATLAGTPGAGTAGAYTFALTATNGVSPSATQSFTLTVDQAPAITSANSTTFTVGTAGTFAVTTTGLPNSVLSESGALPGGVTFTDNGNGTATLAGTPAAGSGDTYAFTLTANNGVSPNATQAFTLTVDQAPLITSGSSATFTIGTPGTFSVTTKGFPNSTLNESGALPGGVSFTNNGNGTAVLAGTPTAGSGGTYSIAITASNGVLPNATQDFTLTVQAANSSLTGYVYMDTNDSGQREISPGVYKLGVPDVTVTLEPTGATALTQSDGSYQFDSLLPGTYTLVESQPQQYLPGGIDTAGKDSAGNSDGQGSTGNTISEIVVAQSGGQALTEYDFGEYLLARDYLSNQLELASAPTPLDPIVQQAVDPPPVVQQALDPSPVAREAVAPSPVVQLGGSSTTDFAAIYTVGRSPVAIASPVASITYPGGGNLTSLTVTITNLKDASSEGFVIGNQTFNASTISPQTVTTLAGFPKITAVFAAGALTLTGSDSVGDYQSLLQSIQYEDTATSPDTSPRTLTVVADGALAASNTATATITFTDPPSATSGQVQASAVSAAPTSPVATLVSNGSLADQVLESVDHWLTW